MDYIDNKTELNQVLDSICIGLKDCIATSISTKDFVNYADEFPRYILNNVIYDANNNTLKFVFEGNIIRSISLTQYKVERSSSALTEFYINNINNNDYFVIIFNCK